MSSIVNKVKDALHSDHKTSQPEGTHSTHNTRAANAADPRIDSDRDHRATHNTAGTQGNTYTSNDNYTYGSGADRPLNTTDGPATRTDGPHSSNMANKADPRVDSDRDHSRNMGANPHGTSNTGSHVIGTMGTTAAAGTATHGMHDTTTTGHHTTATHGGTMHGTTVGHSTTQGVPEGTYGHHNTRAANAADPRVDSDLDSRRNVGTTTGSTGMTGMAGTTGTHTTTGHHTVGQSTGQGVPEGTYGHHNTRAANAADPRIDSDLDSRRNVGTTTGSTSMSGTTGTHTTTGHHTAGNTMGGTTMGGTTHSTGPAPNTAGPHKSDMMNKADPRVDSNLDGSKTVGGDKTFSQSSSTAYKDPTDATQVPPSVLQKHVGGPVVAHDDHSHEREKRHSISHQEQHRGL